MLKRSSLSFHCCWTLLSSYTLYFIYMFFQLSSQAELLANFAFHHASATPKKGKACVSAFIHFQWKFKQIPFTQSLLTPDMVTINKLVAQPTSHDSFQNNFSFSNYLYCYSKKGNPGQAPLNPQQALRCTESSVTCHEDALCTNIQCFSYGVWQTVRQWAILNLSSKFFSPEETFGLSHF